jgi:hypothetical protein
LTDSEKNAGEVTGLLKLAAPKSATQADNENIDGDDCKDSNSGKSILRRMRTDGGASDYWGHVCVGLF